MRETGQEADRMRPASKSIDSTYIMTGATTVPWSSLDVGADTPPLVL